MTSRSQQADLEAANRLQTLLPEQISLKERQRAGYFISKLERDEWDVFLRAVEEAIGRLALRAGQMKQEDKAA